MLDPDYELFATIVTAGSLSAAARATRQSPAMVSKRLARLEDRLGVRLIHRTTRRLALTDAGRGFHADLRGILEATEMAERRLRGDLDRPVGTLNVNAPTSFGRMHLAPHLAQFIATFPELNMRLELSDEYVDLLEGRADIAIRIGANPGAGLTALRLANNERVLCAAPSYIERCGTPKRLADIQSHKLLAAEGQLPWHLTGPSGNVEIRGESHVRTNSSEVVRELALAGVGIAYRSLWDVQSELAGGKLVQLFKGYGASRDTAVFAVYLPGEVRPAIKAFIDFLMELYRPTPPWMRQAM